MNHSIFFVRFMQFERARESCVVVGGLTHLTLNITFLHVSVRDTCI